MKKLKLYAAKGHSKTMALLNNVGIKQMCLFDLSRARVLKKFETLNNTQAKQYFALFLFALFSNLSLHAQTTPTDIDFNPNDSDCSPDSWSRFVRPELLSDDNSTGTRIRSWEARAIGGANYVESIITYTGEGGVSIDANNGNFQFSGQGTGITTMQYEFDVTLSNPYIVLSNVDRSTNPTVICVTDTNGNPLAIRSAGNPVTAEVTGNCIQRLTGSQGSLYVQILGSVDGFMVEANIGNNSDTYGMYIGTCINEYIPPTLVGCPDDIPRTLINTRLGPDSPAGNRVIITNRGVPDPFDENSGVQLSAEYIGASGTSSIISVPNAGSWGASTGGGETDHVVFTYNGPVANPIFDFNQDSFDRYLEACFTDSDGNPIEVTIVDGNSVSNIVGNATRPTLGRTTNCVTAPLFVGGEARIQLTGIHTTFNMYVTNTRASGTKSWGFTTQACNSANPNDTTDTDGDGVADVLDLNPNNPTAADDMADVTVGQPAVIDILANDDYLANDSPYNQGTTAITNTGNGTAGGAISFDPVTGELTYTPLPSEAGSSVTIEYQVCNTDPNPDACTTATVTVNAEAVVDTDMDGNPDNTDPNPNAPTATDDTGMTDSSTPATIAILDNDDYLPNNDSNNTGNTIINGVSNSGNGTAVYDPNTGEVTYTPGSGDEGATVTLVYEVCNDVNNDSPGTVTDDVCTQATVTVTIASSPGPDFDGDGVPDETDLDDDNDGILDTDECSTFGSIGDNLVPNGDFETGDITGFTTNLTTPPGGVGTYAVSTDSGVFPWGNGVTDNNGVPNNTDQFIYLCDANDGPATPDLLLQTSINVPTTGAYRISIWTAQMTGSSVTNPPELQFNFGGTDYPFSPATLALQSSVPVQNWVELTVDVNLTAGTTVMQLLNLNPSSGSGNNFALDDVSLRLIGCTTDTDGDNIPDSFDTDSDNDGCPDAIEGAGAFTTADLTADDNLANMPADVDTDGVPNVGSQATTTAVTDDTDTAACASPTMPDNDNDGVPDTTDLDDDNDGILDAEELSCNNGIENISATAVNTSIDNVTLHDGTSTAQTLTQTFTVPGCPPNQDVISYQVTAFPSQLASNTTNICADVDSFRGFANANGDNIGLDKAAGCDGGIRYRIEFTSGAEVLNLTSLTHGNLAADEAITITSNVPLTGITYKRDTADASNDGTNGGSLVTGSGTTSVTIDNVSGPFGGNLNVWEVSSNGAPANWVEIDYRRSSGSTAASYEAFTLNHTIPCDSDCDSTPDYLDTDSDNDGCPDAIEGAGSFTTTDLTGDDNLANSAAGVDSDGVPNAGSQATTAAVTDASDTSACDPPGPCDPMISPIVDLNQVPIGNVTFQFTSPSGSDGSDGLPVNLDGITVSGEVFTDLITPDAIAYFFTNPDDQKKVVTDGNNNIIGTAADGQASFEPLVLAQAQSRDMNFILKLDPNVVMGDYVDSFYNDPIFVSADRYAVSTERGGNNTSSIQALDASGTPIGNKLQSTSGSNYGPTGMVAGNGQAFEATVWPLTAFGLAPGTQIYGVRYVQEQDGDGADGKVFVLRDPSSAITCTISAEDDDFTATPVNGATGGTTPSVFTDNGNGVDDANGTPATDANIDDNISIVADGGLTGVTINSDGTINVPANTPAGSYTITYQVCLADNNMICDTADIIISVTSDPDNDMDGIPDSVDLDDDNDGIPDTEEGNGTTDTDGDGIPDSLDLDSDNDGIPDVIEAGGTDNDGDGVIDGFTDTNNDGLDDATAATPLEDPDSDNDGVADRLDLDADNDGIPDVVEAGGADTDGDGVIDGFTDVDGDGFADSVDTDDNTQPGTADGGTALPNPDTDGDGVPDNLDLDSDNDGITDVMEAGGTDADGDGRIDGFTDTDGDGFADSVDTDDNTQPGTGDGGTPLPTDDFDGDGNPDYLDIDSDNDGITDTTEAGGTDADGDGVIDGFTDSDGDGLDDATATTPLPVPNTDGTGGPDYLDIDADDDGIVDNIEAQDTDSYVPPTGNDTDGDGLDDAYDTDNSGTAVPVTNTDGTDNPDYIDTDSDNDGIEDIIEGHDTNADGTPETTPSGNDADGDGLDDAFDNDDASINPDNGQTPSDFPDEQLPGDDRDWRQELDSDGDGVTDDQEIADGTDPNNPCDFVIANITEVQGGNWLVADCDGDGVTNEQELNDGTNPEDPCDFDETSVTLALSGDYLISDCDGDGVTNGQEITDGSDPENPCDFIETSVTLDRSGDWLLADCDGDTIANNQEVNDGTNVNDPCSNIGGTPPAGTACDISIVTDLVNPGVNNGIFQIRNIEQFPDNDVKIYNRWGVLVFETQGYDNQENAFRGISNGRVTVKANEELPVGIYFYIINYRSAMASGTKSGYLYVNR